MLEHTIWQSKGGALCFYFFPKKKVHVVSVNSIYKHITLLQKELQHHVVTETPIKATADYFSVLAAKSSMDSNIPVQMEHSKFILPPNLDEIIKGNVGIQSSGLTNENCYQSHMTTFKKNPYSFGQKNKVGFLKCYTSGLSFRAFSPKKDNSEQRTNYCDQIISVFELGKRGLVGVNSGRMFVKSLKT